MVEREKDTANRSMIASLNATWTSLAGSRQPTEPLADDSFETVRGPDADGGYFLFHHSDAPDLSASDGVERVGQKNTDAEKANRAVTASVIGLPLRYLEEWRT